VSEHSLSLSLLCVNVNERGRELLLSTVEDSRET
jgi:hypothetical protein